MPDDLVKILKTQDEGYVRTMRATGLKVSFYVLDDIFCSYIHFAENRKVKSSINCSCRYHCSSSIRKSR